MLQLHSITEGYIQTDLKKLPSVEKILEDRRVSAHVSRFSRNGITRIVRDRIESYREYLLRDVTESHGAEDIFERIVATVEKDIGSVSSLRRKRVINASGVVLHTNLGRALLSGEARRALDFVSAGYIDLEMDMVGGRRTDRDSGASRLLGLLTGSESALVVNNTAAAVLLAVNTFAGKGAVAVSRGELVEIGGSFRLPEILSAAAGRVIEVGTTNRTNIGDYEKAIDDGATLLLKVHTSNYRIVGYTDEVELGRLVALGRKKKVPVMYDQGNGILFPFGEGGPKGEEDIESLLQSGIDMISFSGDKVLGGPQAGVIVGSAEMLEKLRNNHLSRALRIDKLTLAALESVLLQYWDGRAGDIPALRMIMESKEKIGIRAKRFSSALSKKIPSSVGKVSLMDGESSIGGGSFPLDPLPTVLVRIELADRGAVKLDRVLRRSAPSVLARIKDESLYFDLRTVSEDEEKIIRDTLTRGIKEISGRE